MIVVPDIGKFLHTQKKHDNLCEGVEVRVQKSPGCACVSSGWALRKVPQRFCWLFPLFRSIYTSTTHHAYPNTNTHHFQAHDVKGCWKPKAVQNRSHSKLVGLPSIQGSVRLPEVLLQQASLHNRDSRL